MHDYVAVSVFNYLEVCAILTENISSNILEQELFNFSPNNLIKELRPCKFCFTCGNSTLIQAYLTKQRNVSKHGLILNGIIKIVLINS